MWIPILVLIIGIVVIAFRVHPLAGLASLVLLVLLALGMPKPGAHIMEKYSFNQHHLPHQSA